MILEKTSVEQPVWEMRKETGQKLNKNKDCGQILNTWNAYIKHCFLNRGKNRHNPIYH